MGKESFYTRLVLYLFATLLILSSPGIARLSAGTTPPALQLYVYTAPDEGVDVNSTFIYGKTEGLLVDCAYRPEDAEKVADNVTKGGRKLKAIFITHPDADHFGGAATILKRFPGTPVYMTATALAELQRTDAEAAKALNPTALPGNMMNVDGEAVEFIKDIQGDYPARPANSMVWVPSLKALLTDDVVFSGIHIWLADSTVETRAAWRKSLERVTAMHPQTLVPGHQRGPQANDAVGFTKKYLEAFDEVRKTAPDMDTFVAEMKKRFPDLIQDKFLNAAAKTSYKK